MLRKLKRKKKKWQPKCFQSLGHVSILRIMTLKSEQYFNCQEIRFFEAF